ncbi:hypothetical protein BDN70DRAFT_872875 [Pholiota conissans]|uniref:Uncharacterized protein n=1 Tax=Pholiota conissans TaxID=109636 RepID=A0A9P6CYK3_9AGAR|nr:hypothetical protein BDN70DRAFT_872875 [Pholiota conissans]
MAAVYLHNQIYAQNPSEPRSDILEHSRNFSTISSATLLTNTTLHSQPTEPLLHTTPRAAIHTDSYLPDQSRNANVPPARLRWEDPLAVDTDITSEKSRWQGVRRKPARWKRRLKYVLEIVIVVWAIYNTIRYFIAFPIYGRNATEGQSFSFALGTSAGVSFALALCAQALFFVKFNLRVGPPAFRHLTRALSVLYYLSSLFILAPAIINPVLIFVWRNSPNPLYNIHSRCYSVEVDVVWSVSHNSCINKSLPWGIWLTLSFIRLILTFLVLIIYHTISAVQLDGPRRPQHRHLRSESYPSTPLTSGIGSSAGIMHPATPTRTRHLGAQHQISDSTLAESSRPPSRLGRVRSQSSMFSNETSTPAKSLRLENSSRPGSDEGHNDHFQSMINQIAQETEDAMELASSDHAPSPETARGERGAHSPAPSYPPGLPISYSMHDTLYDSDDDDDADNDRFHGNSNNIFNLPPIPPALGYNEFGLPYPPDEDMRVLNGFIRRMPTIESMGSGEITASIAGSTRLGGSISNSSRPPTRNTLLSFTSSIEYDRDVSGSAPPSRPSSLSARAELLAGMAPIPNGASEHGELLSRPDIAMKRVSSPTSFLESPVAAHGDTHSSGGSGATTVSYHTATIGSSSDSYPPLSGPQPKS